MSVLPAAGGARRSGRVLRVNHDPDEQIGGRHCYAYLAVATPSLTMDTARGPGQLESGRRWRPQVDPEFVDPLGVRGDAATL